MLNTGLKRYLPGPVYYSAVKITPQRTILSRFSFINYHLHGIKHANVPGNKPLFGVKSVPKLGF